MKHSVNFIDLTSKRFGGLKVISFAYTSNWISFWKCLCDCGNHTIVMGYNLRNKHTTSCGCHIREVAGKSSITHGMRKTRFYRIFSQIKDRCNNRNTPCYKRYGGRRIKLLWRSFKEFKDDMYGAYKIHIERFGEKNTTIERVDNEGNYSVENCRWATLKEQARNKRNNSFVSFSGERHTISEWAEKLGMKINTLHARIRYSKWSIEKALSTPVQLAIMR